jgi:hypothetical protein
MVSNLEKRSQISSACVSKISSADGRLHTVTLLPCNFTHQRPCILAESLKSYCHIKISLEFIFQIYTARAGLGTGLADQLREAPRLHWNNQEILAVMSSGLGRKIINLSGAPKCVEPALNITFKKTLINP